MPRVTDKPECKKMIIRGGRGFFNIVKKTQNSEVFEEYKELWRSGEIAKEL